MQKKFKQELKEKFERRLMELNSKLDPQFRLSRIDIEDIVNSRTVQADALGVERQSDADVS